MTPPKPLSDSTIDPYEVEYYSKLADTWWDIQGPFWPLHTLNQLRVDYIVGHLITHFSLDKNNPYPLEGLQILDIGCGGGILSEAMAK